MVLLEEKMKQPSFGPNKPVSVNRYGVSLSSLAMAVVAVLRPSSSLLRSRISTAFHTRAAPAAAHV